MSEKQMRHLYAAATWEGQSSVEGRTFKEWEQKVSDFGLDDARQALNYYVEFKYAELCREAAKAAKAYSLSGRIFKIESNKVLDEGIDPENPMEMSKKITALVEKYGDPMREAGRIMDEAVDALIAFETEFEVELRRWMDTY